MKNVSNGNIFQTQSPTLILIHIETTQQCFFNCKNYVYNISNISKGLDKIGNFFFGKLFRMHWMKLSKFCVCRFFRSKFQSIPGYFVTSEKFGEKICIFNFLCFVDFHRIFRSFCAIAQHCFSSHFVICKFKHKIGRIEIMLLCMRYKFKEKYFIFLFAAFQLSRTNQLFLSASLSGLPDFYWCNIPKRRKYTKLP
jgi:hypothetical protein